ncbi:MAG: CHASE domain-containing protein [Fibrobacteria bacterium]|nr:CHASE domain-containing protein [Fibrobacteria bacterium]
MGSSSRSAEALDALHRIDRPRLLIEVALCVLMTELSIMVGMPYVFPELSDVASSVVDVLLLALVSGPLIFWRLRANLNRAFGGEGKTRWIADDLLLPIVAMCSMMVLTAGVVHGYNLERRKEATAQMELVASRVQREIQARFDRLLYGLHSSRSFLLAVPNVDRALFRAFWDGRRVGQEFPGVRGFGIIQQIPRSDSLALVQEQRRDGAPDFAIRSAGSAPDLFVITHIEPVAANGPAWGLDVGFEDVRREGIEAALRMGRPILTGRIVLVQDGARRAGFLFLLPLQGPLGPGDPAFGHGKVTYASVVVDELLEGIDSVAGAGVAIRLWEGLRDSARQVYGTRADPVEEGNVGRRELVVGDRSLLLEVAKPEGSMTFDSAVVLIVCAGTSLSLLVGIVIWMLGAGRRKAEDLALAMNADLLEARRVSDGALRESRAVFDTIHAHAIVSMTDRQGRLLEVNDAFCQVSGYGRRELIGKTHRVVNSGFHDVEFWNGMWKCMAAGRSWRGAIRNRSKSGRTYWIDTIVAPILDESGQPERFLSIGYDITDR